VRKLSLSTLATPLTLNPKAAEEERTYLEGSSRISCSWGRRPWGSPPTTVEVRCLLPVITLLPPCVSLFPLEPLPAAGVDSLERGGSSLISGIETGSFSFKFRIGELVWVV